MRYPSLQEIEKAELLQLARWSRFLPEPGSNHVGSPDHWEMSDLEDRIRQEINKRLYKLGGITVEIEHMLRNNG
jgi:hypothetical protein